MEFVDILIADTATDATATDSRRTAGWHLGMAEMYAATAAEAMASQIERGGGSVNPPHAVRFAEMHAQLAIATATVESF